MITIWRMKLSLILVVSQRHRMFGTEMIQLSKTHFRITKIYGKYEFPSILADTDNDLWVPKCQNAKMLENSDFHF